MTYHGCGKESTTAPNSDAPRVDRLIAEHGGPSTTGRSPSRLLAGDNRKGTLYPAPRLPYNRFLGLTNRRTRRSGPDPTPFSDMFEKEKPRESYWKMSHPTSGVGTWMNLLK